MNRIECLTVDLSIELLSIMEETDLNKLENLSDIENLIGCLVNMSALTVEQISLFIKI